MTQIGKEDSLLDFGFYNMDCMDGMRQFPDKYFDLAIVDPPYGIKIGGQGENSCTARKARTAKIGGVKCTAPKIYHSFNDEKIPDKEYFDELERVAKNRIIWGGNYFIEHLGNTPCMIFWDKDRRDTNFADGELAWTSFKTPARCVNIRWNGMLQENMKDKELRIHPTQKPIALYEWCLTRYAKQGDKILDTHVGSASSLIACHRLGFNFVGFELDEVFYDMAKKRLEAEQAQMSLFEEVSK